MKEDGTEKYLIIAIGLSTLAMIAVTCFIVYVIAFKIPYDYTPFKETRDSTRLIRHYFLNTNARYGEFCFCPH